MSLVNRHCGIIIDRPRRIEILDKAAKSPETAGGKVVFVHHDVANAIIVQAGQGRFRYGWCDYVGRVESFRIAYSKLRCTRCGLDERIGKVA